MFGMVAQPFTYRTYASTMRSVVSMEVFVSPMRPAAVAAYGFTY
jgi:hypothetical protein